MRRLARFSSVLACVATASMAVSPVLAAGIPMADMPQSALSYADNNIAQWDGDKDIVYRNRHRRHHRHRRYDDGVSSSDILGGLLIVGGIAALASILSNKDKNRTERNEETYRYPRRDRSETGSIRTSSGISGAADRCVAEIERNVRVEGVDSINRDGEGWLVTGRIYDGKEFACRINNQGQISDISYDSGLAATGAAPQSREDRQWSNDRYAQVRRNTADRKFSPGEVTYADFVQSDGSGETGSLQSADLQPAYPGGPIEGDILVEEDPQGE